MGHAGVRWVMQGWGGSYRGGVDHTGVGWVIQGWGWSQRGGVGHAGVKWVMQEWSGSCRGGGQVGHREAGWVGHKNIKILKILNCWCYRVSNPANQTQICMVLNFLNHDK